MQRLHQAADRPALRHHERDRVSQGSRGGRASAEDADHANHTGYAQHPAEQDASLLGILEE